MGLNEHLKYLEISETTWKNWKRRKQKRKQLLTSLKTGQLKKS